MVVRTEVCNALGSSWILRSLNRCAHFYFYGSMEKGFDILFKISHTNCTTYNLSTYIAVIKM